MTKAYMLISCNIGDEKLIYSKLRKIPEIKNCLITFGSYDVVAEFETESSHDLTDLISSKIRKMTNIRSTITLRVSD